MMTPFSLEELNWWESAQPTEKELYLSGGLLVEDWPHARHVVRIAADLFQATRALHQLDDRDFRLLERAALLHNAGMLIDTRRHHKHSFRLIMQTKLPDMTDEERHEVACIARYHRRALPSSEHEEFASLSRAARKRVSALAALVRIADALDYNHDGRVLHVWAIPEGCDDNRWTLGIEVRPLADLDDEVEHANEKADLFEKVFKRKLRLIVRPAS